MSECESQRILTERPSVRAVMPAIIVSASLFALACGVGGWEGKGWAGERLGPGLGGLLGGVVVGFSLSVLLQGLALGSLHVVGIWATGSRTRQRLISIGPWFVLIVAGWWMFGWTRVASFALRAVPMVAVLGVITWLTVLAKASSHPGSGI